MGVKPPSRYTERNYMSDIAVGAIVNGIGQTIAGTGTAIGAGITAQTQADINRINVAYQEKKLDWDKKLQQTMFEREDNAIQRRKADLIAAGMSPVLAAGQGALAGPVVQTQAPQINRAPDWGAVVKNAGTGLAGVPGAILDAQAAILRNKQMESNIAQTQAQTELTRAQAQNAGLEGQFQSRSLEDRIWRITVDAKNSAQDYQTKYLQNVLQKMQTTARLSKSATPGHPYELSKEDVELGLDKFINLQDPKTEAEIEKARAEAIGAGIGNQFDQLMLDYEREIGRVLKAAGDVGSIIKTGASLFQDHRPRNSIIKVRGR